MMLVFLLLASVADLDAIGKQMLDPLREQTLHPSELVARLKLRPDDVIADVGAGPGFLTIPIARAVPSGSVIATDIRADYLEVAAQRAAAAKLRNVRTQVVAADHPGLDARSVDLIILCQVDHYLGDREAYFGELLTALRPGGRIALVNYRRNRDAALTAARRVGLRIVDEWRPSPPFFAVILQPR
jgi:ubiquinone/menaquinone biosynthesis C-methylase UbiE